MISLIGLKIILLEAKRTEKLKNPYSKILYESDTKHL